MAEAHRMPAPAVHPAEAARRPPTARSVGIAMPGDADYDALG